ncbi:MAG: hypothetical protein WC517_03370 [Patescibacteria group bacterium]
MTLEYGNSTLRVFWINGGKKLIVLVAVTCVFIGQSLISADLETKEKITIPATANDINSADIFTGKIENGVIVNPLCIDTAALMEYFPETKEAEKCRKLGLHGKYWIMLSQANDRMTAMLHRYIREKGVSFLCQPQKLFKLLRQEEAYKDKSDEELAVLFDITDDVIKYFAEQEAAAEKDKDKEGLLPGIFKKSKNQNK